jgi:hypothetical protein
MDIQKETYDILGERVLRTFDSKSYVDWAMKLLTIGHEVESLAILAGMDNDTTEDREKYFWSAVKELNININKKEFELIENYAICLARQVVNNQMSARKGLSIMMEIVRRSDYSNKYMQFYDVDEDVAYLDNEGTTIFDSGLKKENVDEYLKREFQLLIDTQELIFDKSLYDKAYCSSCGQINSPKLKIKYQLTRPYSYQAMACSNCGNSDLYDYRTQKGREKIIDERRKTAPNTVFK